jgi:hypothetical protein
MARDDSTLLYLGLGAAALIALSPDLRSRLGTLLAPKTVPSGGTNTQPPASGSSSAGQQSGAGSSSGAVIVPGLLNAGRTDAPSFTVFRVRLPTSTLNEQLWAKDQTGRFHYVTSPSEFGRFGIAADVSNVTDIPWGQQRAFANQGGNVSGDMVEWVRSDTPTGVTGLYPQVPSSMTEALREGFKAGRLVPAGPVGYAVLQQQGVI